MKRNKIPYNPEEDNLYAVERAVSMYDVLSTEKGREAIQTNNKALLENVLYNGGFDVSKGYTITDSILHRAESTNEPVFCPRIEGYERSDKEWLKSGYATEGAIIGYCNDSTLRAHLRVIGQRANHTATVIDNMKKHSKEEK